MFVRIDATEDHNIEGWEYLNKDGEVERVRIVDSNEAIIITITDSSGAYVAIYEKDIPKLIKALQLAKKYINESCL